MNSDTVQIIGIDYSQPIALNLGRTRTMALKEFMGFLYNYNCLIGEKVEEVIAADDQAGLCNDVFMTSTGRHLGLQGDVSFSAICEQALSRGKVLSARESAFILVTEIHGLVDEDLVLSLMQPVKLSDGGEYILVGQIDTNRRLHLNALDIRKGITWSDSTCWVRGTFNQGLEIPSRAANNIEQLN
jgi:hypothetical protein